MVLKMGFGVILDGLVISGYCPCLLRRTLFHAIDVIPADHLDEGRPCLMNNDPHAWPCS